MEQEKSCGAVIFNSEGKVLIVKHNAGHWDFPKGHMESGESEEQTALREVKEETNIDIKLLTKYRYESHYSPKENVEKTVVFFLAQSISDQLVKQDAEIANIGWFENKEAMDILTFDNAKEIYLKAYNDYLILNCK